MNPKNENCNEAMAIGRTGGYARIVGRGEGEY
jgi:hypothetical protein